MQWQARMGTIGKVETNKNGCEHETGHRFKSRGIEARARRYRPRMNAN